MKSETQPSAARSAQHSPGPWRAGEPTRQQVEIFDAGGFCVATVHSLTGANPLPQNAGLITAAPALLQIARAVQRAINAHDCEHPDFLDSCADVCQLLDEMADDVRNAIDKAEGRASAEGKEVAGR